MTGHRCKQPGAIEIRRNSGRDIERVQGDDVVMRRVAGRRTRPAVTDEVAGAASRWRILPGGDFIAADDVGAPGILSSAQWLTPAPPAPSGSTSESRRLCALAGALIPGQAGRSVLSAARNSVAARFIERAGLRQ